MNNVSIAMLKARIRQLEVDIIDALYRREFSEMDLLMDSLDSAQNQIDRIVGVRPWETQLSVIEVK